MTDAEISFVLPAGTGAHKDISVNAFTYESNILEDAFSYNCKFLFDFLAFLNFFYAWYPIIEIFSIINYCLLRSQNTIFGS